MEDRRKKFRDQVNSSLDFNKSKTPGFEKNNTELNQQDPNSNTQLTTPTSQQSSSRKRGKTYSEIFTDDYYRNHRKKYKNNLSSTEKGISDLQAEQRQLVKEKFELRKRTDLSNAERKSIADQIRKRQNEITFKELPELEKKKADLLNSQSLNVKIMNTRDRLGFENHNGNDAAFYSYSMNQKDAFKYNASMAHNSTDPKERQKYTRLALENARAPKNPGFVSQVRNRVQGVRIKAQNTKAGKIYKNINTNIYKFTNPIRVKANAVAQKLQKVTLEVAKKLMMMLQKIMTAIGEFLFTNPIGWAILVIIVLCILIIVKIQVDSIIRPGTVIGANDEVVATQYSHDLAQWKGVDKWAQKQKRKFQKDYHVSIPNKDIVPILMSFMSDETRNNIESSMDLIKAETMEEYIEQFVPVLEKEWTYETYENVAKLFLKEVEYKYYYYSRIYTDWNIYESTGELNFGDLESENDIDKKFNEYQKLLTNSASSYEEIWSYQQTVTINYRLYEETGTEEYPCKVWVKEVDKNNKPTGNFVEKDATCTRPVYEWVEHETTKTLTCYQGRNVTRQGWTATDSPNFPWDKDINRLQATNSGYTVVKKLPQPPYPNATNSKEDESNKDPYGQYWITISEVRNKWQKRTRSWTLKNTLVLESDDNTSDDLESLVVDTVYYDVVFNLLPTSAEDTTNPLQRKDINCEGTTYCRGEGITNRKIAINFDKGMLYESVFALSKYDFDDQARWALWSKIKDYRDIYEETIVVYGLDNLSDYYPNFDLSDNWRHPWDEPSGTNGLDYGQCTWFARGVFREIYSSIIPDIDEVLQLWSGNGKDVASNFTDGNEYFELQDEPAPGAIISMDSSLYPEYGHVGIVLEVNGESVKIIDGNYDGITNVWEEAIYDWDFSTYSTSQLAAKGAVYAVYNGVQE